MAERYGGRQSGIARTYHRTVGCQHVELRLHGVYVKQEIHHITAIGINLVVASPAVLFPLACRVNVGPVNFESCSVVSSRQVCRHRKNRRVQPGVASRFGFAQTILVLIKSKGNEFATFIGHTGIGELCIETSVLIIVHIQVAVHGVTLIADGSGHLVAGHHGHLIVQHLAIHLVGRSCQRHHALATLCGIHRERVEFAVGAADGQVLAEVKHIVVRSLSVVAAEVRYHDDIAVNILGRDGAGVVGEEIGGNARVYILRGVVHQAVAIKVETVAQDEVGELEARSRLHLQGIGLAEGDGLLRELTAVGLEHITVQAAAVGACATRNGHVVLMHHQAGVDNRTAVVHDALHRAAAGLHVVPVHLVTHTVHTGLEVGGHGKGRRINTGIVARGGTGAVLAVEVGVGHEVLVLRQVLVGIVGHVILAVAVHVQVNIAVHPITVPAEGRSNALAGFGGKGLVQPLDVQQLLRILVHVNGLCRASRNGQGDLVQVAVVAGRSLCLIIVDGIIGGGETRRGHVAEFDIIDVEEEVLRAIVRRLQFGHHQQVVDVDTVGTAHGEHGIEPLTGRYLARGGYPELFGGDGLPRTVSASSHTDEHHAAVGGSQHFHMNILRLARQCERLFERHHGSEGVAAEAGTLCAEHIGRTVGGESEDGVFSGIGVGRHRRVALPLQLSAGTEG